VLLVTLIFSAEVMVLKGFSDLEAKDVQVNVKRAGNEISNTLLKLESTVGDWSPWDETYAFVQDGNEAYIENNLLDGTLVNLKINFMLFINNAGKVVYGKFVDLAKKKAASAPPELIEKVLANRKLIKHKNTDSHVSGVAMISTGPVFVASKPVLKSDYSGPIMGALVIGKYLNDTELKHISEVTHLALSISTYESEKMPADFKAVKTTLSKEKPSVITVLDDKTIAGYMFQNGVSGNPAFMLKVTMSRDIYHQGQSTLLYYIFSVILIGIVFTALMMFFLTKTVLSPLGWLSSKAGKIGQSGDLSYRMSMSRNDEIGTLASEFDKMLAKLAEERKKLTEQTYMEGMAEMASGVLHNVRNSLTPLVGDLQLLRDKFVKTPVKEVKAAQTELDEGITSEERRNDLIRFSLLANKSLTSLIHDSNLKLGGAMERIGHIEEILDDHQKWTCQDNGYELIDLNELAQDSKKSIEKVCKGFISIDVDPSLSEVGLVTANRISVKQVFHNLIVNAVESVQRMDEKHGKILIHATKENKDGNDVKHIQFKDNGEGIEPELLKQVFARGYSTKQKAGSGIGLHWCANVVTACNGKLYAESEGRGKGACFHLELPDKTSKR